MVRNAARLAIPHACPDCGRPMAPQMANDWTCAPCRVTLWWTGQEGTYRRECRRPAPLTFAEEEAMVLGVGTIYGAEFAEDLATLDMGGAWGQS